MLRKRIIPPNILPGKRIMGFRPRNFVEGIIGFAITAYIICSIPFVPKVKWILVICVGLFVFALNGIGIHGQSFTQALFNLRTYKKYLKNFPYRRLNHADTEPEPLFETVNGRKKVRTIRANSTLEKAKRLIGR